MHVRASFVVVVVVAAAAGGCLSLSLGGRTCADGAECAAAESCVGGRCVEVGVALFDGGAQVDAGEVAVDGGALDDAGVPLDDAAAANVDGGTSDGGRADDGGGGDDGGGDGGAVDAGGAIVDAGFVGDDAGAPLILSFGVFVYPGGFVEQSVPSFGGAPLEWRLDANAALGAASLSSTGLFRYDAIAQSQGVEHIALTALNDLGASSAVATVYVLARHCAEFLFGGSSTYDDEVFWLDVDGPGGAAPFPAYCQPSRGGYALAVKTDGSSGALPWGDAHWTTGPLLNADAVDLELGDATLRTFETVAVDDLIVDFGTPIDAPLWAGVEVGVMWRADSLRAAFLAGKGLRFYDLTREAWLDAVAGGALQPNCGRQGINVSGGNVRARIGFVADNETSCTSSDSAIGVGLGSPPFNCGHAYTATTGNVAGCGVDRDLATHARVWVRSRDFTGYGAAASCAEHLGLYRTLRGRYLVGGDVVTCDQEGDGGGWMLVADVDPVRDGACPPGWEYRTAPVACMFVGTESTSTTTFDVHGVEYSEVRATAIGYQSGGTDAFNGVTATTLIDRLGDGLSLTTDLSDDTAQHVWTWVIGNAQGTATVVDCPCQGGPAAPAIVGAAYTCESGTTIGGPGLQWYPDDPVWDFDGDVTSCDDVDGITKYVVLAPTTRNLDARLMRTALDENVGVRRLEVWVR